MDDKLQALCNAHALTVTIGAGMGYSLIDTHCHLDFPVFEPQIDDILLQCQHLNISRIIVPGVIAADFDRVRALCSRNPLLEPALGLHPCFMEHHSRDSLQQLELMLDCCQVVAIGEIGLDLFHSSDDLEEQRNLLMAQLAIASEARLPVILHVRKAHDQVQQCLRKTGFQFGGVVHAYSGSLQQAQKYQELGFKLGIGGGATYNRARRLHKIIKSLPAESFVLETDAPDIPPCFAREQVNSPVNLPAIAHRVCQLCELDDDWVAQTTINAETLFRL